MDLIPTWRFILFVQTEAYACIHVFVNRCCVALMCRIGVNTRDLSVDLRQKGKKNTKKI